MKAISLAFTMALVGGCAVDGDAPEARVADTEQAVTTTDVFQSMQNGGSASASFWNANGGGYLDVYEYKTKDSRYAYLSFSTYAADPTSQQCYSWTDWFGSTWDYCYYTRYTYSYGWGSLPESDVQFTPGMARINTTLGATVNGSQCTYDWTNWTSTPCTSLSGGTIDLRWRKDGVNSTFFSGTNQSSWGGYTFKSQGTYRTSSARAEGSVLGMEVTGASGYFGDSRGTNITKTVFKTPQP